MKAASAFLVFAGFGLVLRYVLINAPSETDSSADKSAGQIRDKSTGLSHIPPGATVHELMDDMDFLDEDGMAADDHSATTA